MEANSLIHARRMQAQASYALIEILIGMAVTAWRGVSERFAAFSAAQRQARARRELRNLSDHFLKDIGVERSEIDRLFR
jgi:uncharacterized protein YjiS (DUF1127 family)